MQTKIIIHSFWSTLIIYLLVVYKKNNNSFILVSFFKDLNRNFSCKIYQKTHKNSKMVGFFCTNAKVHEMTKMLYKCTNNLSPGWTQFCFEQCLNSIYICTSRLSRFKRITASRHNVNFINNKFQWKYLHTQ